MADTHVIEISGLDDTEIAVEPGTTLRCIGRANGSDPSRGWAFAEVPDLRQPYADAMAACKRQHAELAAVRTRLFEVEAERTRLAIELLSR